MVKQSNTKKVLHLGPNFKRRKGGIASVLKLYKEYLNNFQFFPTAYFQNTFLNFVLLPLFWFVFCFKLFFSKRDAFQIIHIHGASKGSFYRKYGFFVIAKVLFRKKVVYHLHGGRFHQFYANASMGVQRKIRRLMNESDCIIVLSDEWKVFIQQNFSAKKVVTLHNMVRPQKPIQKKIKQPLVFLYIGKVSAEKGIEDLLNVIVKNKKRWNGKVVFWVGGNGAVKKLENFIEEHQLHTLVNYLGWISGAQKETVLSDANVMLLPSYHEGLPISLLEGMSYTMPLIATSVGGIPLILKDSVNGISIMPGKQEELVAAIEEYIENPKKIIEHGEQSYALAQHFFPERVLKELEDIYKNLS